MHKLLYGISGFARNGKDSFREHLQAAEPQYKGISFADPIREMASRIFAVPMRWFTDGYLKSEKMPDLLGQDIALDDYLEPMREATGLSGIEPHGLVATTPRELLQYFGTNYVRAVDDKYWVNRGLADLPQLAVISDTRFPNEAKAIRARGGRIIKVVRGTKLWEPKSAHPTEACIDEIEPDLLLLSYNDDTALFRRVAGLVAMGYWQTATEHDYGFAWMLNNLIGGYRIPLEQAAENLGISIGTASFLSEYYGVGETGALLPELLVVTPHARSGTVQKQGGSPKGLLMGHRGWIANPNGPFGSYATRPVFRALSRTRPGLAATTRRLAV